MAILGGDIRDANDPLTIDTLEDLRTILTNTSYIPASPSGNYYIAFPEVYDGPKVIDLRSRGWNPITITSTEFTPSTAMTINIYFNGWTILGLSMMDSTFFYMRASYGGGQSSSVSTINIYDMIIKNAYIFGLTSDCRLLRFHKSNSNGSGSLRLYRCKISAMLDSQYSNFVYCINNSSEYGYLYINQCSFNLQAANSGDASRRVRCIFGPNSTSSTIVMTNSILSISSKRWICNEDTSYVIGGTAMRFCKVVGDITGSSTSIYYMSIIKANGQCAYNVVDLSYTTTSAYDSSGKVGISFGSGVNLVNTSKLKHKSGETIAYINGNYNTLCTTAQLIDKDWLNDHYFICGDAPSS
jgi:hypothetical protein